VVHLKLQLLMLLFASCQVVSVEQNFLKYKYLKSHGTEYVAA